MKKFISVIIIISMCLSVTSTTVLAESVGLDGGELLKQYATQNDSSDEVSTTTELTVLDQANINAEYIQNYIDSNEVAQRFYGGCYIDDDDKLHVLFTNDVENDVINNVNIMTNDSIVIEKCVYTFDELEILKETISDIMISELLDDNTAEIANDIVAVGLYQKQNKVFVKIKDCKKEKIELFKKLISDSNAVVFENSDGLVKCSTSLKSGWSIAISTSTGYWGYSIAFRCKRLKSDGNYATGFMTAAHGNNAGDYVYNSSATKRIGYIMSWCYTNNGRVDAAFVYLTNTEEYEMSNTIRANGGTLVSGAYAATYTEGNTVYMAGGETGLTSGKITSSSAVANGTEEDPVTIRDCVIADYLSVEGDSGGLVYIKQNGNKYISGINMARCLERDEDVGSYFVKAKNVIDVFDLIVY